MVDIVSYEEVEAIKRNVDRYMKSNKPGNMKKLSNNLHVMLQWLNPNRVFGNGFLS